MSPAAAYSEPTPALTAQRGGLGAPLDLPRPRMTPAEIPLTLSADVLRVPVNMNTRAVLAEIVSLHAATGGQCDCSDTHLAARLTISKDTASVAVQLLVKQGLVRKDTVRLNAGFYRKLVPVPAAIAAAAATNPYPEFTPSLPGNSGDNIPLNLPLSLHTLSTAADAAGGDSKKNSHDSANSSPQTAPPAHRPLQPKSAGGPQEPAASAEAYASPSVAAQYLAPPVAPPPPPKQRRRPAPPEPAPLLPDCCLLAELLNPPGDAHRVQLLAEPLTEAQATKLLDDYPHGAVRDILCQMANWQKLLTSATSVNLTARNWLTKRAKETNIQTVINPAYAAQQPISSYPTRPVNGHKPAGHGGSLARLLAESD